MSYWIRLAGMAKPPVITPGPVKAAVMVTESGEFATRTHPIVVGIPRPKASAASDEWVLHNSMPAKTVGNRRDGRKRLAKFNAQTGTFMIADPFWFRVGLLIVYF